MRTRVRLLACVIFALALTCPAPTNATDVDGPNDCTRPSQDFGDAPENIDAYLGVPGRFPTCLVPGAIGTQELACPPVSSAPGPAGYVRHFNDINGYWLGCPLPGNPPMGIDSEADGKVNLNPAAGTASVCSPGVLTDCVEPAFGLTFGQDECTGGNDAGVTLPTLMTCMTSTVTYNVYNCGPTRNAFLNILVDMNRDGDWNDNFDCGGGLCAYEWAVINQPIVIPGGGCWPLTSPSFLVGPNAGQGWMRVTISDNPVGTDFPWNGAPNLLGGETEDYPVVIEEWQPDPCDLGYQEFGDAPENLLAYPGVIGRFPTCLFGSPAGTLELGCLPPISLPPGAAAGFVRHVAVPGDPIHFWLGCGPPLPAVDGEADGKVNLNPAAGTASNCTPTVLTDCVEPAFGLTFGQDECTGDVVDAGIATALQFLTCSTANVTYTAYSCTPYNVYLNILVDWNQDGDWNDAFPCPGATACAYEWAVKNQPVPLVVGCQTLTSQAFLTGPNAGNGWLRITLTQTPVPDDFPWNGSAGVAGQSFQNGETEDYPVTIRQDPCGIEYQDFGDAPEGLPAYPSGILGAFPTCIIPGPLGLQQIMCGVPQSIPSGPAGYVRHVSGAADAFKVWLGCGPPGVDGEADGKVNLNPAAGTASVCNASVLTDCVEPAFGMVPPFGQDECYGDLVDAGIASLVSFQACSKGKVTFNAMNCRTSTTTAYLNILVDWNEDADWNDNVYTNPQQVPPQCRLKPNECAYEWAVKNVAITLPPGCATYTSPQFQVGPRIGFGWMRITLTQVPVPDDFPWNGSVGVPGQSFQGGETEDYPVTIVPGVDAVGDREAPRDLHLGVSPNPSRDVTSLELALPQEGPVTVGVYDIAGRKLRELVGGTLPAGRHVVHWDHRGDDGRDLSPGLYLVKLHAQGRTITRSVVYIR